MVEFSKTVTVTVPPIQNRERAREREQSLLGSVDDYFPTLANVALFRGNQNWFSLAADVR